LAASAWLLLAPAEANDIVADPVGRPSWMDRAACRGDTTSVYSPALGDQTSDALLACGTGEVRGECLAFAMRDSSLSGTWAA